MGISRRIVPWLCAFIAVVGLFLTGGPAYLWALHLESKWMAAKPATRAALERHLSLYSARHISPAQSMWGSAYVLLPGERMVQYLILWDAPLDVVYDSGDNVRQIFTSYE